MKKRIIALAAAATALAITATAAFGASATGSATLPTLALKLTGKSITAPATVPAGAVNVVSTVSGEPAGSPTLVRLEDGVTFQQAVGIVTKSHGMLDALQGYATIVFNSSAPKGTSTAQVSLKPGNYVAIDTTGNNPAKQPHAAFTVSAGTGAALPKAQVTEKMYEFAFSGPSKLKVGQVVRVDNTGYLYHMAITLPVKNKANAAKLVTALKNGDRSAMKLITGQPGALAGTIAPAAVQQAKLTAKPGYYVLACFMATGDGREHTRLGMEKIIQVVK